MQPFHRWVQRVLAGALGLCVIVACGGRGDIDHNAPVSAYLAALERFPGSADGAEVGLARFTGAYQDLTSPALIERLHDLYAPTLYFNDTLAEFRTREALLDYLGKAAHSLSDSRVDIHQVLRDGNDVFVRWTMYFSAAVAGRRIDSTSIGMTHLRFDADGRVVLHQDFWDSAGGLYEHLPVVGFLIHRTKARIQ